MVNLNNNFCEKKQDKEHCRDMNFFKAGYTSKIASHKTAKGEDINEQCVFGKTAQCSYIVAHH